MTMVTVLFVVLLLLVVGIGFFCAHRLDGSYLLVVRLVTVFPAVTALVILHAMVRGAYAPQALDLLKCLDCIFLYSMVASRFTTRPWLDIRTKNKDSQW